MSSVKFDAPVKTWTPSAGPRLASRSVSFERQDSGTEDEGIGIGVLAGIIRTRFAGEDLGDFFESRNGTMLGFWVGGNTDGLLGFTGEFIYIIRKTDIGGGSELSHPAFSIPAVFHVNFGPADRDKGFFYVVLGPVFTFNLSQKIDGETVPDQDAFKGADIGFLGGAGFEIFRIAVEVRHNWGLRNISSEGAIGEIKTRAWEFLVKFRFN